MRLWRRLFGPATCAGCGSEYVRWEDTETRQGVTMRRLWRGCPTYRDMDTHEKAMHGHEHGAYWTKGKT